VNRNYLIFIYIIYLPYPHHSLLPKSFYFIENNYTPYEPPKAKLEITRCLIHQPIGQEKPRSTPLTQTDKNIIGNATRPHQANTQKINLTLNSHPFKRTPSGVKVEVQHRHQSRHHRPFHTDIIKGAIPTQPNRFPLHR